MNKTMLTIVLSVFVIGMFSLAFAAENDTTKETKQAKAEGNMTYGQCVSQGASMKNTCYTTTKTTRTTCIADAKAQNSTKDVLKTTTKACDKAYKTGKSQCMKDFKAAKSDCKKIKHNVFDTVGAAFRVDDRVSPRVEQ